MPLADLARGVLVADAAEEGDNDQLANAAARAALDLSQLPLVLRTASAEELAEHEALLADVHKASGGKRVWPMA